jgi:MoxR-like ATPase
VSEHLAAAVSGSSRRLIQCTAGTDENQIRYGWNYAQLLAHGPSHAALVATPLMRAMESGKLCRFEELTRMGSDVQDTLITVLSEKMMPIPELNSAVYAQRGFNIIATANNRDTGVNELSSALKRRFNVVVLPLPDSADQEVAIIVKRVGEMAQTSICRRRRTSPKRWRGWSPSSESCARARPRTARWRSNRHRADFRPPRRSR